MEWISVRSIVLVIKINWSMFKSCLISTKILFCLQNILYLILIILFLSDTFFFSFGYTYISIILFSSCFQVLIFHSNFSLLNKTRVKYWYGFYLKAYNKPAFVDIVNMHILKKFFFNKTNKEDRDSKIQKINFSTKFNVSYYGRF